MKQILFLSALVTFSIQFSIAQPDFNPVVNALKSGNMQSLSSFFDKSVEVTILDKYDMYDQNNAAKVIGDFLAVNRPSTASIIHKGMSDDKSSHYAILNLTAGGKGFRVYIYMKQAGGRYVIKDVRFDKQK